MIERSLLLSFSIIGRWALTLNGLLNSDYDNSFVTRLATKVTNS